MRIISLITLLIVISSFVEAQTRRRPATKTTKPTAATPVPTPSPTPEDPVMVKTAPKKNERPASDRSTDNNSTSIKTDPSYRYEFSQPEFAINKIVIEHDDAGRGTITFSKKWPSDTETDPINISTAVLERINGALANLNFLDSTENYQYEKDYSHLGVITFRLKHGDKQRTTTFNYTTNKDAKMLSDQYRKISSQAIWIFDITVARENQPLEAPRILDSLDSLLRRDEIADPTQLIPLLNGMKDDERVPLIARNHAGKLVERIEKGRKEK